MGSGGLSEAESAADVRAQLFLFEPAVDGRGALSLLVGDGVEHGETEQREVTGVERPDGEDRLRLPARYDDNAAAASHQVDDAQEVGLALRFVPDAYALALGKIAHALR